MKFKTIKVEVTAEDIANGVRGSCRNCPVALAIDRALKLDEYESANVGKRDWIIDNGERGQRDRILPRAARYFIREFDSGGWAKPFTFNIRMKLETP